MKKQNEQKKWITTGEALNASAMVYGFRVDHIHSEAYRMLNAVNRNNMPEGDDCENGADIDEENK